MASLYWIEASLAGLLPCLWMFLGVGLPWAFAALSTRQWRSKALIAATALALGPAWMTGWMLLLGVAGAQLDERLLTREWVLAGSVVIAALGCGLAWRKRGGWQAPESPSAPFEFDEKLIIALIGAAVVIRWIHTAFFPFTAYDPLWVFGYQGRLFTLESLIPNAIDYYPPYLSLQFAYAQTLIGGVSDHAARMVLPMQHIGSILASYLLGARLANRRVGLFAAALWSLHPYVGQWAMAGDLEIPLTFNATLAAAFFLRAWRDDLAAGERRREALLAGVMLGIALFTKPTAGALVWGILLLLGLDLLRKRFDLRRSWTRLETAMLTGLACLPLGAVWYLRNLALGHEAITLPPAIWLTRALRSGDYLAPLLLALAATAFALALQFKLNRRAIGLGAFGMALALAGALASNPRFFPQRIDPPASHVSAEEALLTLAGAGLMAFSLRWGGKKTLDPPVARLLGAGGWALLLALPYYVTYFYSYSYHYRLGFAVMPLLCLPTAIALSLILTPERLRRWRGFLRRGYALVLCCLCLPGVVAAAVDVNWSSIWLLDEKLDSDIRKYQVFNPSLMEAVFGLRDYIRDTGKEPIVLAPGEERLPFFFPQTRIIDKTVGRLAEYEALGATHFIYGAKAREAYLAAGLDPLRTQLVAALGRADLFQPVKWHYDGTFSYELYASPDVAGRRELPERYRSGRRNRIVVLFDERIRLRAHGAYPDTIFKNTPITMEVNWRALAPLERDLSFVIRLQDVDSGWIAQEWTLKMAPHRHGDYATTHWETDEFVHDRLILELDREAGIPHGENYAFLIGVWDPGADRFLSLTIDGEEAGEFYRTPRTHILRMGTNARLAASPKTDEESRAG